MAVELKPHKDPGTRKEQILRVACQLFAERGYAATSVRDIAAALNLQGGSLYSHIGSKEELLWEIVDEAAREFLQRAESAVSGPNTAADRLRRLVRAHVGLVAKDLAAAACYLGEWRHLSEERQENVRARRNQYESYFRNVIEDGVASGEFSPTESKFAALFLLGALNWARQWFRAEGPLGPEEVADRMSDLILRGVERAK